MCWILVKKAGNELNEEYMDIAQSHNPDGYGVAWHEDGFVKTYKSFDYDKFKAVCKALESHTLVIHLRYATKGSKSYANIHPFDTPSGVMFHNGTMYKVPEGEDGMSDSQTLADILMGCNYEKITDIKPLIEPYISDKINRLVFFEDSGEIVIMNQSLGIWDNGDWYSNDYHLKGEGWCRTGCAPVNKVTPKETKPVMKLDKKDDKNKIVAHVFVYGTLKRGFNNHSLLSKAKFLGKAETIDYWTMISNATNTFPYVLRQDDTLGDNIQGEVYAVTKEELDRLDRLEGVPSHYKRQVVDVEYEDGIVEEVIMYVKTYVTEKELTDGIYISEWSA